MPSKDFSTTASMLDSKRLNKQILECYQILKVLSSTDPKAGWRNHPAVKMWRGYENALYSYTLAMVAEADKRGIKTDTNMHNLSTLKSAVGSSWGTGFPEWYQNSEEMKRITVTHMARLFVKDPIYYAPFSFFSNHQDNEPCCSHCNYYWPTHTTDKAVA